MIRAGACDVLIISWGCDLVGGAASGMFEEMITGLANAVFSFALMLLTWVWTAISETTVPQTSADWLYTWAGRVFGLTLPITVGLLILQVVTTVLRSRSTAGIGRVVLMAGAAVFGTSISLPIVHLLTSAVDAVADGMTQLTFGDMEEVGERLRDVLDAVVMVDEATGGLNFGLLGAGSVLAGAVAFIIFGIMLVLGALAVWAALLIRSMLLYITIVLAPIAIMGLAWDYTRGWFKKWVAVANTLIWSKLAIMVVFGLGVSAIEGADFGTDGAGAVGVLLSGALMMLMAALVPIACFSFMSFVGDEVHASTLHRGGTAAASAGKDALTRANAAGVLRRITAARGADADEIGGAVRRPPSPTTNLRNHDNGRGTAASQSGADRSSPDSSAPVQPAGRAGSDGAGRPSASAQARGVDARRESPGGWTPTRSSTDERRAMERRLATPASESQHLRERPESRTTEGPQGPSNRAADRWRAVAKADPDTENRNDEGGRS